MYLKIRVNDISGFKRKVFGGEDMLKLWPQLETTGVDVLAGHDGLLHMYENGQPVGEDAVFEVKDMAYFEVIPPKNI
jgi:hypothetical protein